VTNAYRLAARAAKGEILFAPLHLCSAIGQNQAFAARFLPRISRMARIRQEGILIREIREIRG
jgi:hypothetical protein